jgi:nucleoside-diphosphate-sugar epimerase
MQLSGKTLCITGIGGFIGLRMAERARALGMLVRGLELDPLAAARARSLGAEVIVGDLCDASRARAALEGAEVVFHTAAIVSEDASWALSRRVNVEGTVTLAHAAREVGTRRFVHLSSVMVYGFDFVDGITEAGPFDGANNPYCQTKLEGDQVALAMHDPGRLEVTVIRPGDVYGPGSIPWVVRPLQLMRSGLFAYIDGGRGVMNHVHVDNLLDAVLASLERDAVGRAFNVTDGRRTTFREFFGYYANMLHKTRIPSVPSRLALPMFARVERGAKLMGRASPVQAAAVHFVRRRHAYSIARAEQELGYVPRIGLEEGMAGLERWLRSEGLVP